MPAGRPHPACLQLSLPGLRTASAPSTTGLVVGEPALTLNYLALRPGCSDTLWPNSWGYCEDKCVKREARTLETVKCCLNGKDLPSTPQASSPAQLRACCVLREKVQPTWLAGSSSSLLSEDPSAFFFGVAGASVLLLAALELLSF